MSKKEEVINKIYEENLSKTLKKLENIDKDIWKNIIYSNNTTDIFAKKPLSQKEIANKINSHDEQINLQWNKIKLLNWFILWLIGILIINMIWWFYEAYFRLNTIEKNYIEKTAKLEEIINIYEKEIENFKNINSIQKDYIDKEINEINDKILKETERQVNNKIIQLNFK